MHACCKYPVLTPSKTCAPACVGGVCCLSLLSEVLCLFEDEVVLLQDKLLHHGLDKKGLPGITYELADLQVTTQCVLGQHQNSRANSNQQTQRSACLLTPTMSHTRNR